MSARLARQRRILDEMGIDVWVRQKPVTSDRAPRASAPVSPDWERLRAEVAACTRCALHRTRTQTVFGVGDTAARWMIIGEAPGADEDRQGEPFVGAAGQLLNEMLRAVGLARTDVFIANILKCRPPENRDPNPTEVSACADYLAQQVRLIAPQLILAVGRIAAQSLLCQDVPVGRLRGRPHAYGPTGIPLIVTYHPAYLLRSPGQKRKAWDDLRLARSIVDPLQS
jgi:DNA polymerase